MTTTVPLRRVATLVNGGTPPADAANWGGDVPWATPVDLAKVDGGFLSATDRTLTRLGARTGSALVPPQSILLSTRAPIGYTAITDTEMAFNQGCRGLIPNERLVEVRHLRYCLQMSKAHMQSLGTGSTFLELGSDALAALGIPLPPVWLQRRIADFLDEQVAVIGSAQSEARALAAAGTARLEGLREQWTSRLVSAPRRPLRSLFKYFQDGDWVEAPFITDSGIRLIQTGNIGVGEYREQGFKYISDETFQSLRCKLVHRGDVLICRLGSPVSRACLAPELRDPMITSVDVVIARGPRDVLPEYVVSYLSTPAHLQPTDLLARGATMQRLSRSQVGSLRIPVPPPLVQREMVDDLLHHTAASRGLCNQATQLGPLLEERKRALITACVTGQLDMTTASDRAAQAALQGVSR